MSEPAPITEETQLSLAPSEPAPAPSPQSVASRVTRGKYQHPLEHYESVYDLKANKGRTIKRWVATGRKKEDLPPLDEPARMAAWWGRCMTWTVPARLLTLAGSEPESPRPASPSSVAQPGKEAPPPPRPPSNVIQLPEGSGFAAAMGRAQEAERTAFAMWQAEITSVAPDAGREEMRRRAWERATEMVRKLEKDAESILSRDMITWPDAEVQLVDTMGVINRSLRSILVRVSTKIGLPHEWFVKADREYQSELDRCFDQLSENDYEEKPPAPVAPPFSLTAAAA